MADETKQGDGPDALRGFLARLATDPAELGRFVKDPHAAMEAANLSPGDRAILQSGNPAAIHARLQAGTGSTMPVISLVVDASGDKDPTLTVRGAGGGFNLLPQVVPQIVLPQIVPPLQILPQQVVHPILPQLVIHPITPPPQQVIHPIFPQQVIHPIFPPPQQVIHPIFPQQVIHPIFPQQVIHPIFPPPQQIYPQVIHPIFPPPQQIHPIFPIQVLHPVFPPPPQQIHPIFPIQVLHPVFPLQIAPQQLVISPLLESPGVSK